MEPLWTASFARITAMQFLTFAAFQMVTPVLPVYLNRFTSNEALIGAAVGVFTLSAVVVRLWMGPLVDRHGRIRVLVPGLVLFVGVSALYAVTWSVETVMVVRVLHGAAFAAVTTAVTAMAADVIPARRRAEGMGLFGTSVNLAQSVAPVLGFAVVARLDFAPAFLIGAGVGALGLMLARYQPETRALDPGAPPATAAPRVGLEVGALVPSLLAFLASMGFGGVIALMPLYAAEQGVANPGIIFTLLAVSVLAVRLLAGRLADRWGAVPLTGAGLILAAAALFTIGAWPGAFRVAGLPGGLLLGTVLYGLGHGSVTPVSQGVSIARVPRARWGAASATFFAFIDMGIGLGSAALGAVAEAAGLAAMYRVSAGLPLVALAVLWTTRRQWVLAGPPAGPSPASAAGAGTPSPLGAGVREARHR